MTQQAVIRVNHTVPSALANCTIVLSPQGKQALELATHRRQLERANGGTLRDADVDWLSAECERLGFGAVWTNFVLGVQ